ncbi:hypothetical protein RMAECT_1557 [Rickettsia rhipicephali str. Ect]|uniref:Uncharacterized protein n=1 Tax=Rickettsia rhipicephali str. Ect TaxID=1359199 RepID=A0A0F3PJF6_RICRH|nr:hypothetical protein RMAECT_1557 [Rickettsia rhipicephali str. Ect]
MLKKYSVPNYWLWEVFITAKSRQKQYNLHTQKLRLLFT